MKSLLTIVVAGTYSHPRHLVRVIIATSVVPVMTSQSSGTSIRTVLVANRGEIAIRLVGAAHSLGLQAVAVFVAEDAASPHVKVADQSYSLGDSPKSYSDVEAVLAAAIATHADAVHPGYGFLSENPQAARTFEDHHIHWLGPTSATISLFGLKHTARSAAINANVPIVPGSDLLSSVDEVTRAAETVGYPVLVKATAGGGGVGQAIARSPAQLERAYNSVITQASTLFSSSELYVERFIEHARHVEVQIFGDGNGRVVTLGDRDCSVQRRRQKVIEEACAPELSAATRSAIRNAAVNLCAKHSYRSAGTVEFIVDANTEDWFFLEVNTRLQVEHGVTEMVSGIDIAQAMIKLADGIDVLTEISSFVETGAAIEARVYAENPSKGYVPCPGIISGILWPTDKSADKETNPAARIRVDGWAQRGTAVLPHFDPLLGKVLAWAPTRPLAIIALRNALESTHIRGVETNLELLLQTLSHPLFLKGTYTTDLLSSFKPAANSIEVRKPGVQSSLQDFPGRLGYWSIGVSPSGPMDAYAMCMGNALVGNHIHSCGLEFTVGGPTLLFHTDAVIAITGGDFDAFLDDHLDVPLWTPFKVFAGSLLTIGNVTNRSNKDSASKRRGGGKVGYLSVRGGFDVPEYLGSASTFPTGKFGGLTGSFLTAGDFLPICKETDARLEGDEENGLAFRWPLDRRLDERFIPQCHQDEWVIAALNGPHASTDFFKEESISELWNTSYEVDHATNRLGARLIGPAPKWARTDGGSAGLHPSNLHDYTYAPGAVNFSGNTPIILMLDGPSLGGFVCPITVATAELWKVAQSAPGERIRFKQVDYDQANAAWSSMEAAWDAVRSFNVAGLDAISEKWSPWWVLQSKACDKPAVLARLDPSKDDAVEIEVVYRMSGDEHVLIEYGNIDLDLSYRLRVHVIMEELKKRKYVEDLCPGVRSLLVKYNRKIVHVNQLLSTLKDLESQVVQTVQNIVVPSRCLELPLAFGDRWTIEAQARYLRSVRPNAPYMPSNIEFVRRINGLQSVSEVEQIVTSAEYMVLGLGDVYLGAPCAVPIDPRHRLVTSKYNPARTYTPEGAVGIGGAYMCIYGMDSPGGYQLVGRTLPIWDNFGAVPEACRGSPPEIPWLLRFFDRVKFFSVTDDELEELRAKYLRGEYKIKIKTEQFSYAAHKEFLEENKDSIRAFEKKRIEAYTIERRQWVSECDSDKKDDSKASATDKPKETKPLPGQANTSSGGTPNTIQVEAEIAARVWSVKVKKEDVVAKGDVLLSLESMKVEISVEAPVAGKVSQVLVSEGDVVSVGDALFVLDSSEVSENQILSIGEMRVQHKWGTSDAKETLRSCIERASSLRNMFSVICDGESTHMNGDELESSEGDSLLGIPFVVSENVDVKGLRTTYRDSGGAHDAKESSAIVQELLKEGAVLIGKTKCDLLRESKQFDGDEIALLPNGCAAASVKHGIASFAVVVDSLGSSISLAGRVDVLRLKTTEGLLPVVKDKEEWSAFDSIGLYARRTSDLRTVFNICMRARSHQGCVLRDMVTASSLSRNRPIGNIQRPMGFCNEEVLATLTAGSSETSQAYMKTVQSVRELGFGVLEVDANCFVAACDILRKSPVQLAARPKLESGNCINGTEPGASGDKGFMKTWMQLQLCKKEADVMWTQVGTLLLPGVLSSHHDVSCAESDTNPLSTVSVFFETCAAAVSVPPRHAEANSTEVFVVAPQMEEKVLFETLSLLVPKGAEP